MSSPMSEPTSPIDPTIEGRARRLAALHARPGAFDSVVRAAEQLLAGSFEFADAAMPYERLNGLLTGSVA